MEKLEIKQFEHYLQARPRDSHKGDFGHVLIIGGEAGYSGAVILASKAALRVGAGLVSVATRPAHAPMLNLTCPEIMCHGVGSASQLEPLLEKASVVVLGPGLGKTDWSKAIFKQACLFPNVMIIDADGLNLLAENPIKKSNWILTPHPGEAGRLLNETTKKIQQDRLSAVKMLQQKYDGWIVLKGAGTLISGPENSPEICVAGNPGMSTAGMGDVLSGVLGGLAAQNIPLEVLAKLGVIIHAKAGDLAAKAGERGMIASDLMVYLRDLVNP
ncbi:MAG TPA: NAD(P)H-hydrate dehydratase [Gammaproteobacteria bacterium]|nr:NAD(P)H-hydrate dehydratase [Gammaproteobacteria bacterium]